MNEAIAAGLLSGFASEIYKDLKNTGKKISENISKQLQADIEKYLINMTGKYEKVKTLVHNSNPVRFYDIYEPISASSDSFYEKYYDCKELFKRGKYFTFFGRAGCGKTTFLKHLAFNCAISKLGIPVTINLRTIENSDFKFFELIRQEIKLNMDEEVLTLLLQRGKIVLFLDGYDETSLSTKRRFFPELKHFTKHFPEIKVLISSRPGSGIKYFEGFINLSVMPFNKSETVSFVKKQLYDREKISSDKMLSLVREGMEREEIKEYLFNPLLLNIFIVTMDHKQEIPDNIQDFYQRILDALFFKHDQDTKPSFTRDFETKLTNGELNSFLNKFAFVTHLRSLYSVGSIDIDKISKVINKNYGTTFQRKDLVYDLECNLSLWAEVDGKFEFAHRSLQEFLACRHIASLPPLEKKKFYIENFSNKIFSAEEDNYEWTLDFLAKSDTFEYLQNFELINLTKAKDYIGYHIKNRSGIKNLLSDLIDKFDYSGLIFNPNYYRLFRFVDDNLHEFLSEFNEVFFSSELRKQMESEEFGIPSKNKLISYMTEQLDSYEIEIDLDLKQAIVSLEARILGVHKKINELKEGHQDILDFINEE